LKEEEKEEKDQDLKKDSEKTIDNIEKEKEKENDNNDKEKLIRNNDTKNNEIVEIINDEKTLNDSDNKIINDNEKKDKNTEEEIKSFLRVFINMIKKRNNNSYTLFYLAILVIIIYVPVISHYIVLYCTYEGGKYEGFTYEQKIEKSNDMFKREEEMKKYIEEKNLEKYITNTFLNIFYRFDIEIVVIVTHWIIFDLRANGQNNILSFFTNIIWGTISKFYFSFSVICNMVILFTIFSSETINSINIYNIFLNFVYNTILILFFSGISYAFLELPFKKLIKYILNRDENEDNDEEEDDNEEDEEEKGDADEIQEIKKNSENIIN
jgi:hypothetical protein